jgi:hypothetical protein
MQQAYSLLVTIPRAPPLSNLHFVQAFYTASSPDAPSLQFMHFLCERRTILTLIGVKSLHVMQQSV